MAFSARHIGLSIWMFTQKYTTILACFRENVATVVLSYTPAAKTMKPIFKDFGGKLSAEEYKALVAQLKAQKHAYLVFSLRHPFTLTLDEPGGEKPPEPRWED